jgi:hypothetical protein
MPDPASPAPRIFSDAELRHLLSREIQRCTRYQDFLSVCLVRAVYRGAPLPEVEAAITRRIAEMLRSTDIVGAIGPETAVLLVHTPETDAVMIVGRMRGRIEREVRAGSPPGDRVTLAVGVASFPTDATSDAGLLAHAQVQLEAARRAPG